MGATAISHPPPALLKPLADRMAREHEAPVFRREPGLIRREIPVFSRLTGYFSPEVRGLDQVPSTGPVLVVGNHSCGYYMPDVWIVADAIVARRGLEQPAYGLAYDLLFAIPGVGPFLRGLGAIPASGSSAERALASGGLLLVYPGGDWEACRPWTQRNHVDFGGRKGFIRLALRTGVPVVPVVTHGSHQAVVVLTRGDRIARAIGIDRLRIKVFPIVLGPPFGIALLFSLPLPSTVTVEFLPALDWAHLGPAAADDPEVVSACYDEITTLMQSTLDGLSRERPHPVARGTARLARKALAGALGLVTAGGSDDLT